MKSHLSSEDLDSALAGKMTPRVREHVSGCAECADEIAAARALFSDLRVSAASVADGYRHAPVTPVRKRAAAMPMAWGMAMAMLFAGVMVPVVRTTIHGAPQPIAAPQAPVAGAQASATLSDDALLNSVQDDLTSSVPASLLPLAGVSQQGNDLTATEQRKTQ